jgi:hypothetical protein
MEARMWDIHPFAGIGVLRFGMTAVQAEASLHSKSVPFRKGESGEMTLAFNELGLHVYLDDGGKMNFVEAFVPCSVGYLGIPLLGPRDEVLKNLRGAGFAVRDDGSGGMWVDSSGFVLFAPLDVVEGVSVYPRGYPGSVLQE